MLWYSSSWKRRKNTEISWKLIVLDQNSQFNSLNVTQLTDLPKYVLVKHSNPHYIQKRCKTNCNSKELTTVILRVPTHFICNVTKRCARELPVYVDPAASYLFKIKFDIHNENNKMFRNTFDTCNIWNRVLKFVFVSNGNVLPKRTG